MAKRNVYALVKKVAAELARVDPLKIKYQDDASIAVYADYKRRQKPTVLIPTGHHAVDRILGGGIPLGRTVEIFGPYSGGKSVLCQEILAQICAMDGVVMLEDTENTYEHEMADGSPGFGARIGIDGRQLLFGRPTTVEAGFKKIWAAVHILRKYDRECPFGVAIDSIAAMSTEHEMRELNKADMTKAKAIGSWLRRITNLIGRENTLFIVVNQTRHKVGQMFGNPETTPGGDAMGFHATQRIRVEHRSLYKGHPKTLYDTGIPIGVRIMVDCVKNKIAPPFRRCEAILNFSDGLVPYSGFADILADEEIIKRIATKTLGGDLFEYANKRFTWYEIEAIIKAHPELLDKRP